MVKYKPGNFIKTILLLLSYRRTRLMRSDYISLVYLDNILLNFSLTTKTENVEVLYYKSNKVSGLSGLTIKN